jgi:glutathione S-transferase
MRTACAVTGRLTPVYELYIANKNYSSWSLRAWILMQELGVPFTEHLLIFGESSSWEGFVRISPSGKVPCLLDGAITVWDSLAIAEYLAERHAGVWPGDPVARAWARSAAAEMHSGFDELRRCCSMSCGLRVRLHAVGAGLACDLARIDTLWSDGLCRFGGPYLAGKNFTAVDAFYAPIAFRLQTYGLALRAEGAAYARRLLDLGSMRRWYDSALSETSRDDAHDAEVKQMGCIVEDLRAV